MKVCFGAFRPAVAEVPIEGDAAGAADQGVVARTAGQRVRTGVGNCDTVDLQLRARSRSQKIGYSVFRCRKNRNWVRFANRSLLTLRGGSRSCTVSPTLYLTSLVMGLPPQLFRLGKRLDLVLTPPALLIARFV